MVTIEEVRDWICEELDDIDIILNHSPLTRAEREKLWERKQELLELLN